MIGISCNLGTKSVVFTYESWHQILSFPPCDGRLYPLGLLSCSIMLERMLQLLPTHPLGSPIDLIRPWENPRRRPSNHTCLKTLVQNYACASYLVLSSIRQLPHDCVPLMSLSHLALCFSSICFSFCNSVPEPLLNFARLKRAPPLLGLYVQLLDPQNIAFSIQLS